ncbi:hypothetical protein AVEN_70975-1, partial [Araneus ventricosus]
INPDVIAVQETKLRFTNRTSIANYFFYSTLSRTRRDIRGTRIFIKNNIHHTDYPNPSLRQIERTIIAIHHPTSQDNINIISTYLPPCSDSSFTHDIEALIQTNYRTILIWDFNAKHLNWNCERANLIGMRINSYAKKLKLKIIAPDHPTRFSKNTDIIDFAIARNIDYHYSIKSIIDLTSDHLPIILHLNTNEINIEDNYHLIPHWNKFRDYLITQTNYHPKINTKLKIEKETDQLTEDIINAFKLTARMKKNDSYETPPEIRAQTTHTNRLRKI